MRFKKYAFLLILLSISMALCLDASNYGLKPYDPNTGRQHGCYTAIEILAGLKEPSSWIRATEMSIAVLMFIIFISWSAIIIFKKIFCKRIQRE